MHPFYKSLNQLDELLNDVLKINVIGNGLVQINDQCLVDTNQQFEMLSHAFFVGTSADNPRMNAYKVLLQNMGLLDQDIPSLPLVRDIPLRTKTVNNQANQQLLFAQFLEHRILTNQWSMLFPAEFASIRATISECLRTMRPPLETKRVTRDAEGQMLSSGGYDIAKHSINGLELWLRVQESNSAKDIEAAVEKTLNDTANTDLIINSLKSKLIKLPRIAFNIRGISKNIQSNSMLQNTDLGGGHQHFLLLDRTTNTIYAINDTKGATDEDPLAFKQQIELFLRHIGDPSSYQFEFVQGKSRQPDSQSFIAQPCNISQFLHYAALSAGVRVSELQDVVPTKVVTLLYLLQYAYINNDDELMGLLDTILARLNDKLESKTTPQPDNSSIHQSLRTTADPTSRGLTAGSSDVARFLDPAVKPRDVVSVSAPSQEQSNHSFKLQCLIMIAETVAIGALIVAGLLLLPSPVGIGLLAGAGALALGGVVQFGIFSCAPKAANPDPVVVYQAQLH